MKKDSRLLLFERMKKVNPDFIIKEDILSQTKKSNNLDVLTRKIVNRELSELPNYFSEIPIDIISDILKKHGLLLLQEDNTPYDGILVGEEGQANFDIAHINSAYEKNGYTFYVPIENSMLILTWYKMQNGKYEIVTYLS